ncbi:Peptidase M18 like protein, partial [Aduncisulcus paluster]
LDLSKNIVVIASVPGLSKKDDKKEKDKKKKSDLPHDEQIMEVICHAAECLPTELLDFDLEFSDGQPCCTVGIDHSMLSGGRQDNLLGCYGCVRALLDSSSQISRDIRMITLFDHEEIGSRSRVGGWTPTLYRTVSRIVNSLYSDIMTTPPDIDCIIARGMALSVDQAHSVHPGYSDRVCSHTVEHMNEGVVLKASARQSYSTSAGASAVVRMIGKKSGVPIQSSSKKNTVLGGGTLGPMVASTTCIRTSDIGVAMLAMHSARELVGSKDVEYLVKFCKEFLISLHDFIDDMIKLE